MDNIRITKENMDMLRALNSPASRSEERRVGKECP